MFALNFLLESAMHEGLIWLKISKLPFLYTRLRTPDPDHSTPQLPFKPNFQLPISIPSNPELLITPAFQLQIPIPSKPDLLLKLLSTPHPDPDR
jgi:hypothetical protein